MAATRRITTDLRTMYRPGTMLNGKTIGLSTICMAATDCEPGPKVPGARTVSPA